MSSVRRGFWTALAGLLLVLGPGHDPEAAQGSTSRYGVACATATIGPLNRLRPAVRSCGAPDVPRVPHEGAQLIGWGLHPEAPLPGPDSRSVVVAVHERGCTGGRNPIPHLEAPEVWYLKGAVVITLWIRVGEGPATCPGNPLGRLRVKLPGPLGDRQLYDGATEPPRKVEPGEVSPEWPYR